MSAIADFIEKKLKPMQERQKALASRHVRVGWAAGATHEKKRARPKGEALSANAKSRKRHGEIVSNFDENFIGPGLPEASLAVIAKQLCYGRAGGVNKKTGKPYGAIPARNFVKNMHENFMGPLMRTVRDAVLNPDNPSPDVNFTAIGVMAKGQLQRSMKDSNRYAPNAPITVHGGWMANPKNGKPVHIDGKGSSRPLHNKGTLIQSVDFEVK